MSEQKKRVVPFVIAGVAVLVAVVGYVLLSSFLLNGKTISDGIAELTVPMDYIELKKAIGTKVLDGGAVVYGKHADIAGVLLVSVSKSQVPDQSLQDLADNADAELAGLGTWGAGREIELNGYAARLWKIELNDGALISQVIVESPEHFHTITWKVSELGRKAEALRYLDVIASFRLKGDPVPTTQRVEAPAPAPTLTGPSAEESKAQAYLEFHEALSESTRLEEREALVARWETEGFDTLDGAWEDLVLSLSGGLSSEGLEATQLKAAERLNPSHEVIVRVLPKVREGVRRGLLARFRNVSESEREVCLAALSNSDDLDHPAILEAYLVLRVVTAYRVRRMIRSKGLAWTRDPLLSEAVRERAREKPAFVEALLGDELPNVRAFGCSLVSELPADGDEGLTLVLPLLRDSMSDVRLAAAEALTPLAKPRASWGLARALAREGDAHVRERMLVALGASDTEATLALIVRLQKRKAVDDQRAAALALQAFAPESILEPLRRALAAKDAPVVEAGLQSLLALAEANGGQALAPCLDAVTALDPEGPHSDLRAQALAALEGDS